MATRASILVTPQSPGIFENVGLRPGDVEEWEQVDSLLDVVWMGDPPGRWLLSSPSSPRVIFPLVASHHPYSEESWLSMLSFGVEYIICRRGCYLDCFCFLPWQRFLVDWLDLDIKVFNGPLDVWMEYFQVFVKSIGFLFGPKLLCNINRRSPNTTATGK